MHLHIVQFATPPSAFLTPKLVIPILKVFIEVSDSFSVGQ